MDHRCSICQTEIRAAESTRTCGACSSIFHHECWEENGGCATYGCPNVPATEKTAGQVERTHWGRKIKNCPYCAESINSAELACPYCHERFETEEPLQVDDIRTRSTFDPELEKKARLALAVFFCGISGIFSPLALTVGGVWYIVDGRKLMERKPMHAILALAGLAISLFFVALMVFGAIAY